jgi:primary-amine oxidase
MPMSLGTRSPRAPTRSPGGRPIRALPALLAALAVLPVAPLPAQSPHPMDPLTFQEHWTVLDVLREADRYDADTGVSLVLLHEPDKERVLAWRPGEPVERAALVALRRDGETYEAVVDLTARRIRSWTRVEGGQAPWLEREFGAMEEVVKEHPDVVAAFARRGITDLTFIDCGAGPPGRFGLPEEEGRRIAHAHCADARGVRNRWTRGIAGLTVVVDMDAEEVIRVVDEGTVPVPTTNADYDEASIGPLRRNTTPLSLHQPLGPAFQLDGYQVSWDRWRFHVRPDHRVGLVVSMVRWVDGDRERPILYQGHMSEIFVPYMDPSAAWFPRNFLDIGEYTAGGLPKPLEPGVDCPETSTYLQLVHAGDNGRPRTVPSVVCIFERYAGDPLWRHFAETHEGRAQRDLVVRMAAVLGNYDYIVDWVFRQDGAIRVNVGATGIVEAKPVAPPLARAVAGSGVAPAAEAPDAWGRFVDRNIVAVNHDHYFNFRLDMDVDGPRNSLQVDQLKTVRLPDDHPRRSLWAVESRVAAREGEARLDMDMHRPAQWRVINADRTNAQGYPVSYQLVPGMNVHTLLTADDYPRRRAGFIDHHLWVTPYRSGERYAAGAYPTLSEPGQGLPAWTAADRDIRDTDIVLWYTFGMHHVARAEDWPVMPVAWHGFELRPFDFFDRNPALDAPRTPR